MKYCIKCGNQLQDENKFCPRCGQDQAKEVINEKPKYYNPYLNQFNQNTYIPNQSTNNKYGGNTLGLVSIGLGVTIPFIGVICGIDAIMKGTISSNKLAKILGIIGISVSIIVFIINIMNI